MKKQKKKAGPHESTFRDWVLTILSFGLIAVPLFMASFNPIKIMNWYDPEYPSHGTWLFCLVVLGPPIIGLIINVRLERSEGKNVYASIAKWCLISATVLVVAAVLNFAMFFSWG